jgi:hypothetical protein
MTNAREKGLDAEAAAVAYIKGGGKAHTPPRSVRIPEPIWQAAKARAEREGTTVTAVILRALTRYAK